MRVPLTSVALENFADRSTKTSSPGPPLLIEIRVLPLKESLCLVIGSDLELPAGRAIALVYAMF
jgi:hypothetical protein